jgi:hypothetical protein
MTDNPDWHLTKGQRRKYGDIVDFDPHDKYRKIAMGIYEWSGTPKNMPQGFIEKVLYEHGKISAKEVGGEIYVLPANGRTYGYYGEIISWTPGNTGATSNIIPEMQDASDNPVLDLGVPVYDMVNKYASILEDSLISLGQNIKALRQPIAIYGNPGNAANGITLKNELSDGTSFIPVFERTGQEIEAIDLKARDYTQSLIATHNAMDNEILTALGVKNTGIEKASGVSAEETTSLHQELQISSDIGLKQRTQWCVDINSALGTNFSVRISPAYMTEPAAVPEQDDEPVEGDDDV